MKKILYIFVLVLLFSCAKHQEQEELPVLLPEEEVDIIKGAWPITLTLESRYISNKINCFSFDFFKTVSQQSDNNIFLSPFSMATALGMVYNGAVGETKDEIAKTLRIEDNNPDEVNQFFSELYNAIEDVDPGTSLSFANAMWANKGIGFKNSFVELNQNIYKAEMNTLDFSLPSTLKTMNDWCYKKTDGTIPEILDVLDPLTPGILANAVYFNSFWTEQFDKTKTKEIPFFNRDGTVSLVQMMQQGPLTIKSALYYSLWTTCSMVVIPYSNTAFRMTLILPNEGEDIDDFLEDFNEREWRSLRTNLSSNVKITLLMPRFTIESKLENLRESLVAMGMTTFFSDNADFSDMLDVNDFNIDVLQKSYISVNEEGTQASSVSVVELVGGGEPLPPPEEVTMVVDRPFLFLISVFGDDTIFFMGKVVKL